jgi:hypothetical protein
MILLASEFKTQPAHKHMFLGRVYRQANQYLRE